MQQKIVKLTELKLNPDNPRLIKDEKFKKLKQSIQDFPEMLQLREIVVDENMVILGGNMRYKAMKELGIKEAPVKIAVLSEEQKREFILKDNIGFGEWDYDVLKNTWDIAEIEGWGFDMPDDWLNEKPEAKEDDYRIPDEIETDIVIGDIFEIGEHRLMCGDSTDSDAVAKLMGGEKADMVFTDPPYDCSAGGRHNSYYKMDVGAGKEIEKFNDAGFSFNDFLPMLAIIAKPNANNIIFCGTYTLWNQAMPFCYENYEVAGIGIWSKPFALSNVRGVGFAKSYEPFVYCWNKPHIFNAKVGIENYDVINMASNAGGRSYDHPTSKPLKLVGHFLELLSNEKELISDLFLGSGTTMVAAHQLNRRCFGMELDPVYCAVIIDRMRKLDPTLKIKKNGKDYQ